MTASSGFIGNASTASKLQTARNITIGNKTKSFDGSGNISFSLDEIGSKAPDLSDYAKKSDLNNYITKKSGAELGPLELFAPMPYIDFHFDNSTADYTSRIIESAPSQLAIQATRVYLGPGGIYAMSNGIRSVEAAGGIHLMASSDAKDVWLHGGNVRCVNNASNSPITIYANNFAVNSSKRYKENIKEMSSEEAYKLLKIKVRSFDYINGDKNQRGFIAEEIENDFKYSCVYSRDVEEAEDKDAEIKLQGLDYSKFIPAMVKLLQLQNDEINKLKNQLNGMGE